MSAPIVVTDAVAWKNSSSTYSVVFYGQGLSKGFDVYLLQGKEVSPDRIAEDLEKAARSVRDAQRVKVRG